MYVTEPFHTSPDRRILIVADAHLPLDGTRGGSQSLAHFRSLIQAHRDSLILLILLGDIFDFWYEWKHVVPKRAAGILYDLHDLVRAGIPVHYFAGNHDFKITGFLEKEIGLTVHMDEWITEIDGRRVFIHHGDGFAAGDTGYRCMKRVFRSSLAQWLFGTVIHPDLSMRIGRFASSLGVINRAKYTGGKPPAKAYHDAVRRILAEGFDMAIIGHTHRAELLEFDGGWYHNPGPFLREYRYSLIEGGLPIGKVWE